jgi:hypothetical protein
MSQGENHSATQSPLGILEESRFKVSTFQEKRKAKRHLSFCRYQSLSLWREATSKLVFPPILVVNWVSSSLSFFLSASVCCYIYSYIFTAPTCTTTIIILEPCALECQILHQNNNIYFYCNNVAPKGCKLTSQVEEYFFFFALEPS